MIRKKNGKPNPIEKYNGKKCYKTCHKGYWESGLFKKQFYRFVDTFPFIAESGTIHVDNFQCYKNYSPYVSIKEMQDARRKMIEYVKSKGIDITSEFTYKETQTLPNKPLFGLPRDHFKHNKMDTLGYIPMSWWAYRMTDSELVNTSPKVYCCGEFREKWMNNVFYGNMHGEDIVVKSNKNWGNDFISQFATYQVPGHYLNTLKRLEIKKDGVCFPMVSSHIQKAEKSQKTASLSKTVITYFCRLSTKKIRILLTAKTEIAVIGLYLKTANQVRIFTELVKTATNLSAHCLLKIIYCI